MSHTPKKIILVIGVISLVVAVAIIKHDTDVRRKEYLHPCDAYAKRSILYIPAKCLSYFRILK